MFVCGCILFLFNLLGFFCLWRMDSKGTLVITPFLLFSTLEIVALWPPTIYAYYSGIAHDAYPMVIAGLGFMCFLVGFCLLRWISPIAGSSPARYLIMPVQLSMPSRHYLWGIVVTSTLLLIMALYLYQGIPPYAKYLLGFSPGETSEYVRESRIIFTKSHYFGGSYRGQGLIRLFMMVGWPFLSVISMIIYSRTKRKGWLINGIILITLSVLFISGDGTRARLLYAMIFFFIVISMNWRLRIRHLFIGLCVLTGMLLFMSFTTGKMVYGENGINPGSVANALFYEENSPLQRISFKKSNGINSVHVIELVESGDLDYRYGAVHLQKMILALPGTYGGLPFSRELSEMLKKKSSTSFTSTTYLATLYVDFGLTGVMVGYLLMGLLIGFSERIFYRSVKTLLRFCLVSFAGFYLGLMSLNGFTGFASSYVVVLVVCAVFLMGCALRSFVSGLSRA